MAFTFLFVYLETYLGVYSVETCQVFVNFQSHPFDQCASLGFTLFLFVRNMFVNILWERECPKLK